MYTKSILFAAALGLQQAAANWDLNASSFKCPGSTPTTCSPQQGGGWTFGGIPNGGIDGFDGFQFGCGASSGVSGSGWTCNSQFQGSSGGKRGLLRRTKGGSGGQCVESDLKNQPQISCSDRDFTAATFDLISDFDVDFTMECDQGNGQTCKQDGHCSKSGSSFQNTQCAGCKSITFKHKGSDSGSCGFGISSIGWECSSTKTSPSGPSTTPSSPGTTTSAIAIVSTLTSLSTPTGSSPISYSSASASAPSSSAQASSAISSAAVSSPTSSAQASPSTTSAPSATIITTQTTSTVISTTEITITSCAATITNCPAESTVVTTSTLTQYTTVCPVTLTQTPGVSSSAQALPSTSSAAAISSSSAAAISSSSSVALVPSSSSAAAVPSSTLQTLASSSAQAAVSSTQSAAPGTTQEVLTTVIVTESTTICPVTATLTPTTGGSPIITTSLSTSVATISSTSIISASPVTSSSPQASSPAPSGGCPSVVPSCLNTWLFSTSCKDNTDIGCFCSLTNYTSSVIGCITAYGADSSEIASALSYLQGICAPYVSANPGIVTAVPTSISVAAVPSGQPASTITVGSTAVTVPAVQFTTTSAAAIAGATTPAQVSPVLVPGPGSSVAAQSSALPGVTAPFPTGAPAASPAPTGTGAVTGANPAATSPILFAGSASKGTVSGFVGLGALVVAVLAL